MKGVGRPISTDKKVKFGVELVVIVQAKFDLKSAFLRESKFRLILVNSSMLITAINFS